jgi:XTP/dITP diphosphohydrolase
MMKVLLATNNPGKIREMQQLLAEADVEIVSKADAGLPDDFDVEETGSSFQEISGQKAFAYSAQTGLACVSDDSGLVVDALNGEPGIHSKRFAPGSDHDRNLRILELMKEMTNRKAKFVSVICYFDPQEQQSHFFEGEVTGHIAQTEQGTQGFGYDPIFIPDGYDQSFAQLGSEVKNTLSHRARALEKLKIYFAQKIATKGTSS